MSNIQKFLRGQLVYVTDEMPPYMRHFKSDMLAIIDHSYSDAHSSGSVDECYSILYFSEDYKILTTSAWYETEQLTLIDGDRDFGEMLIQQSKSEGGCW